MYDRVPNHAISDPVEAAAWRAALTANLPPPPARILDAGAGTGAIALLLAESGYPVTALDLSERMLERARDKAAERGLEIDFVVGPVEEPPPGPFDTTPPMTRTLSLACRWPTRGRRSHCFGPWSERDGSRRASSACATWNGPAISLPESRSERCSTRRSTPSPPRIAETDRCA